MNTPHDEGGAPPGFDPEAIAFLGISTLPGVGFQSLQRIGGREGLRHLLERRETGVLGVSSDVSWEQFGQRIWVEGKRVAALLGQHGVQLAFDGDEGYPARLLCLPEAKRPQWLFMRGDLSALEVPSLAVVGTRDPSPEGLFIAQYAVTMARALDVAVVSGLARGIDAAAHEWALRRGCPTVSVLGTGILRTYPANHRDLGDRIVAAGGLLISEYPPNDGPQRERFVARNRLQAALSHAVIAAEWSSKSGTAHTVRYARELKRPVYGIRLAGQNPAKEAGTPDRAFSIPLEEPRLYEALQNATVKGSPAEPHNTVQELLFEGEDDAQTADH